MNPSVRHGPIRTVHSAYPGVTKSYWHSYIDLVHSGFSTPGPAIIPKKKNSFCVTVSCD